MAHQQLTLPGLAAEHAVEDLVGGALLGLGEEEWQQLRSRQVGLGDPEQLGSRAVGQRNAALDVDGDTASRSWRTTITRPDDTELVIPASAVDPHEFTAIVQHYRGQVEREDHPSR